MEVVWEDLKYIFLSIIVSGDYTGVLKYQFSIDAEVNLPILTDSRIIPHHAKSIRFYPDSRYQTSTGRKEDRDMPNFPFQFSLFPVRNFEKSMRIDLYALGTYNNTQ